MEIIKHGRTYEAPQVKVCPDCECVFTYVKKDIKDFCLDEDRALIVTNPPYGERLLDIKEAEELYKVMGERFTRGNGQKYFVISPHDDFEKIFGNNDSGLD